MTDLAGPGDGEGDADVIDEVSMVPEYLLEGDSQQVVDEAFLKAMAEMKNVRRNFEQWLEHMPDEIDKPKQSEIVSALKTVFQPLSGSGRPERDVAAFAAAQAVTEYKKARARGDRNNMRSQRTGFTFRITQEGWAILQEQIKQIVGRLKDESTRAQFTRKYHFTEDQIKIDGDQVMITLPEGCFADSTRGFLVSTDNRQGELGSYELEVPREHLIYVHGRALLSGEQGTADFVQNSAFYPNGKRRELVTA